MRILAVALVFLAGAALADTPVSIGYLRVAEPVPPTLSNLDPPPEDLGPAGALTGVADANTTGRFLGRTYALTQYDVAEGEDPTDAAIAALTESPFLLIDGAADVQTTIADLPEADGALLFNVSSGDGTLRDGACRANLLHTAVSDAMRTDALAQFLVQRRWTDLALITGPQDADAAFAEALRASLPKFGLELSAEKAWDIDADMRRNAAQEVPLFTQDLGDYDALIVVDEIEDFGRYIAYNTWQPRPIVGSEGLVPRAWAPVVEQWGAAQLQSRFIEEHARPMRSRDYAAWAAVVALSEAVTRTESTDPATLRAYLLGPDFELAGFKGRPLTFRPWNGQLRQPIPLVHERALVAQAPLEGFLHQRNEMDSLGLDEPESDCEAFQ
ncbi:MAG: ABC transporter substrate-binding protein [Pseudomonadota bacterium]